MRIYALAVLFIFHYFLFSSKISNRQSQTIKEINGIVLDGNTKEPLLYTNIYVLNTSKGTISNERGHYSMNIAGLNKTDTLCFQYLGYKTRNISIAELEADSVVYLKEDLINLSDVLVFAQQPDAIEIVKKVLKNKDRNYKTTSHKKLTFVRTRTAEDIETFNLDHKKSTIPEIDRKSINALGDRINKHSTSFEDFLGEFYFDKSKKASEFKVDPIRAVILKEDDLTEPGEMAKALQNALTNTKENEYWKVKSGVFSTKMDTEDLTNEQVKDSLGNRKMRTKMFTEFSDEQFDFIQLTNKDEWDFLYNTGKYDYLLNGGTHINGENVYIIDFTPKKNGLYLGRMFISIETSALIRADFKYAPERTGRSINLLGFGLKETNFYGSIYFEKKQDNYELKYSSRKKGMDFSLDRNFSLIKKQDKAVFNKKVDEIKVGINMKLKMEELVEMIVLKSQDISNHQYINFEQPSYVEAIFVKQFDDNLWKDYDIIEPTQQMKDYKKHGMN